MNILFGLSILIKQQDTFAFTNIGKYINNKFWEIVSLWLIYLRCFSLMEKRFVKCCICWKFGRKWWQKTYRKIVKRGYSKDRVFEWRSGCQGIGEVEIWRKYTADCSSLFHGLLTSRRPHLQMPLCQMLGLLRILRGHNI